MDSLILWWLLLEALGLIALPLTSLVFSARADHGYIFSKIVGLLVISYLAWVLGFAGVAFGNALWIAGGLFAAVNLALAWVARERLAKWLRGPALRTIVLHDALWTFGLLFFAWQRSLWPQIVDQEKYMDFAFFNTLQRTDVMPPEDPWMSGLPFNYYYFGYLMFANLARVSGLASPISYNLCVATIAGLAFAQLCAIGLVVTRRLPFALLTGAMGMLFGNLDGLLQLIKNGNFTSFDYFRSTRIVGGDATINEFPLFTSIHGDLHPHFLVLPVQILLLGLLLDPQRFRHAAARGLRTFRALWPYVPVAFVLGTMVAISIWELPVGAMVTFLLMQRYLPMRALFARPRLLMGVGVGVIVVVGYVLYLPFYLNFIAPPGGVGVKFASTSLFEFLTVFGGLLVAPALFLAAQAGPRISAGPEVRQLLAAALALLVAVAYLAGNAVFIVLLAVIAAAVVTLYAEEDGDARAPVLLALGAAITLLACELVYLKDPYGEKLYRMNTVFKLYLQSWILLAIAGPWCLLQLTERKWASAPVRAAGLALVGAALLASCAYPIGVSTTRTVHRMLPLSLDGNAYLQREHADDYAAIQWLRNNVQGLPVILEATGNPYSYYARFASNTGLPTVLGWANHEGLWRGHDRAVGQRSQDIARIYNAASLDDVTALLDQYNVRYVVVGELERRNYQVAGLEKFAQLPVAFSHGGTTIYQR